jgi:hypothetical protein
MRAEFGTGSGSGDGIGFGYELLRVLAKKAADPKGPAALWQRVLLLISPIAWTSLKQFVIRIIFLVNRDLWNPVIIPEIL